MKIAIYFAGALAALMCLGGLLIVWNYLAAVSRGVKFAPYDLRLPGIAAEFATQQADLDRILAAAPPTPPIGAGARDMKEFLRKNLRVDYGFIVAYWVLFVLLSLLLTRQPGAWAIPLAALAMLCATGAAIFDWRENGHIEAALAAQVRTDALVASISPAAHWKWALVFTTILLLSFLFTRRDDWGVVIGYLSWLVFALSVGGLLWHKPLAELAFVALVPLLGLMAWLLLSRPDSFIPLIEGSALIHPAS